MPAAYRRHCPSTSPATFGAPVNGPRFSLQVSVCVTVLPITDLAPTPRLTDTSTF